MSDSTHHNRYKIAIIGCGIAGYSHLVDCVFHPNIIVEAVCSTSIQYANKIAKQFSIENYFDNIRTCLRQIGHNVDVVVFSVPPPVLPSALSICLGDYLIVIDKPGCAITGSQLSDRTNFYYSRPAYSDYQFARHFLSPTSRSNSGDIHYCVEANYYKRYKNGNSYLSNSVHRGVILDTVCHFLELYFSVYDQPLEVRRVKVTKFVRNVEVACSIEAYDPYGFVYIDVLNTEDSTEDKWRISAGGKDFTYIGGKPTIISKGIERTIKRYHQFSFSDQLILLCKKQRNIFIDTEKNNKILQQIDTIYEFLAEN